MDLGRSRSLDFDAVIDLNVNSNRLVFVHLPWVQYRCAAMIRPFAMGCALASLLAGCASAGPRRTSEEPPYHPTQSTGWVSLDRSREATTDPALRARVADERRELLAQCDEVLVALESSRNANGSLVQRVVTSVLSHAAAVGGQVGTNVATGQAPAPPDLQTNVGVTQSLRLANLFATHGVSEAQLRNLREGRHALVAAESPPAIIAAMDRLRPLCVTPR